MKIWKEAQRASPSAITTMLPAAATSNGVPPSLRMPGRNPKDRGSGLPRMT